MLGSAGSTEWGLPLAFVGVWSQLKISICRQLSSEQLPMLAIIMLAIIMLAIMLACVRGGHGRVSREATKDRARRRCTEYLYSSVNGRG